jgi:hypothetical protein
VATAPRLLMSGFYCGFVPDKHLTGFRIAGEQHRSRWGCGCERPRRNFAPCHEPNLPSGGRVADVEIGAFLIAAGNGPGKSCA